LFVLVAWRLAKLGAKVVDLLLQLDHAQLAAHHGLVEAIQLLVGGPQFVCAPPNFLLGCL
jgi:hypothetical protein